ncbi:dihydropteroate synthase-like protein [Methanocaldococcus villosus KIN24-T80]|uniref:Dihydropteroate synthase-like protein n=1 Tax=Methanocaldococcus villosus KIN24-T80 TaxID=1069083 RepID=N6V037_9EURY|nr:dihydropteroate synthase-like protein [Methanocaldococcus villosus KIN24-T80]
MAEKRVKEAVKKYDFIDIHVANISVAAFLTPNLIIKEIKNLEKKYNKKLNQIYDFVLVTGLIRHDLKKVEEETGIACYKSTREAADIPLLIENLDKIKLSTKDYADLQLIDIIKERAEKEIEAVEKEEFNHIKIGNLKVGDDYPIRVLGEIVHAPWLKKEELEKKVMYYVECGADMIDLGMVSNENNKDKIKEMVSIVKDIEDIPVSIDTMNIEELKEAINYADLILSLDRGNIDTLIPYLKDSDVASVVLPTDYKNNIIPKSPDDKIKILKENIEKLLYNNIGKIIADPILEPINEGFIDSLIAYKKFKEFYDFPTFFGAGNVSELLDADSNGVHALLTAIAYEVRANIIFSPEASAKCKFSIKELKTASKMMFLAKRRNSLPKDLGIDLINYKDKRFEEEITFKNYNIPIIDAKENEKTILDEGSFKIEIDRENKKIIAIYFKNNKPTLIIRGEKAKEIYDTIINLKLIKRLDHACYLGRELSKAEIALKIGKKYNQDFELFYNDFWR